MIGLDETCPISFVGDRIPGFDEFIGTGPEDRLQTGGVVAARCRYQGADRLRRGSKILMRGCHHLRLNGRTAQHRDGGE